ncbi:MAG TPA: aldo/keto reductase, partial [Bacillota bacterium]
REASREACEAYDREHVTPWIIAKYNTSVFKTNQLNRDLGYLRCTMDTYEDYLRVVDVYQNIPDPVNVSWVTLVEKLATLVGGPGFKLAKGKRKQGSELTLGTAQLGMKYGIANRYGKPTVPEAISLIHKAIEYGLNSIDTARGYGEAEYRVGEALKGSFAGKARVVTKLDPLAWLGPDQSTPSIAAAVEASVYRSCRELGLRQLPVLLLHRWAHRHAYNDRIWQKLLEMKEEKVIGLLGASVQSPEEALEAIQDPEINQVQLPFNILDWRWRKAGVIQALEERQDLIVHVRSVFLQGILTSDPNLWPKINGVNAREIMAEIDELVKTLNRKSRADLCIAYVRAQPWVDSLVIGMETLEQLEENIRLFQNKPLTIEEAGTVEAKLSEANAPEELLNPALWAQGTG